jgi:hypothetical protein
MDGWIFMVILCDFIGFVEQHAELIGDCGDFN